MGEDLRVLRRRVGALIAGSIPFVAAILYLIYSHVPAASVPRSPLLFLGGIMIPFAIASAFYSLSFLFVYRKLDLDSGGGDNAIIIGLVALFLIFFFPLTVALWISARFAGNFRRKYSVTFRNAEVHINSEISLPAEAPPGMVENMGRRFSFLRRIKFLSLIIFLGTEAFLAFHFTILDQLSNGKPPFMNFTTLQGFIFMFLADVISLGILNLLTHLAARASLRVLPYMAGRTATVLRTGRNNRCLVSVEGFRFPARQDGSLEKGGAAMILHTVRVTRNIFYLKVTANAAF